MKQIQSVWFPRKEITFHSRLNPLMMDYKRRNLQRYPFVVKVIFTKSVRLDRNFDCNDYTQLIWRVACVRPETLKKVLLESDQRTKIKSVYSLIEYKLCTT